MENDNRFPGPLISGSTTAEKPTLVCSNNCPLFGLPNVRAAESGVGCTPAVENNCQTNFTDKLSSTSP